MLNLQTRTHIWSLEMKGWVFRKINGTHHSDQSQYPRWQTECVPSPIRVRTNGDLQVIFNPPGGVLQADAGSNKIPNGAGRSVIGTSSFLWFYIPNTASFLITLFLTVLFLTRAPKAELVLLPIVPLFICYVIRQWW